ncbi:MAG: undecaprenyldiphospho-muramoylpentapeptide beta-N-acetylglucosaminyltransferase [Bacteroidota bacterium]|nr:undecaprenyldiphospho-muramoylpentapeptide beta-N-acetylglucosaminyltransferase [Bacteroidota bacterium]
MLPLTKVIISGGGTGGHIYPAVSIAQELEKQIPGINILFVGAKGKMEMEKVPKAGFEIEGLWISGLQRKLTLGNLSFPIKVLSSIYIANIILNKFKPQIAIGVGGYASGPLLYTAGIKGIPTLIHEQNSYAGLTNKWLSKRANKICVAYDGMEKYFPAAKIVKTGNPVRQDLQNMAQKKQEASKFFGLGLAKKTILFIGGSLGARTLNQTLKSDVYKLTDAGYQVIWQTGKLYYDEVKHLENENVKIYDFIYQMDLAYAMADVIVSRAGASSISEIALVGKPLVLVPSPNVSEDHQTKNAMALVNKEAAMMVKDIDAKSSLMDSCLALMNDIVLQNKLATHIKFFATPDAAKTIVSEILSLVK